MKVTDKEIEELLRLAKVAHDYFHGDEEEYTDDVYGLKKVVVKEPKRITRILLALKECREALKEVVAFGHTDLCSIMSEYKKCCTCHVEEAEECLAKHFGEDNE